MQRNIQSSSNIMIFKISSFLTLALALSSPDAVTAVSVPRQTYNGGEGNWYWTDITTASCVSFYLFCAAMLKSSSNSIIYLIGMHVGLLLILIQTWWDVFIFSRWASITENLCFLGCCHSWGCTLRLRIIMNGCGLTFTVFRFMQ